MYSIILGYCWLFLVGSFYRGLDLGYEYLGERSYLVDVFDIFYEYLYLE